MSSVRFDPRKDFPPTPFDHRHTAMAKKLKRMGLPFDPHVGCFVWDSEKVIQSPSPFPNRIYFILSLPRFLDIFGSKENIAEKLVWLPTWHQVRVLCEKMGIGGNRIVALWQVETPPSPGQELLTLYSILIDTLKKEMSHNEIR